MENAKPRRGRGRPSRAEASAKTMAALQAAGIDPASIDPRSGRGRPERAGKRKSRGRPGAACRR
jgi:hypothetical protein